MTAFKLLKQVFLLPFWRRVPVVVVGQVDQWALPPGLLSPASFVVSAGVGHAVTFEQDLVRRFGAHVVLLDPSPTGIATMERLSDRANLDFRPVGLAGRSGALHFGPPAASEEGSFRKGRDGEGISFPCTSLDDLMRQQGRTRIDLLKIDVEGFEYEVLQAVLDQRLDVGVICVEIHHDRVIAIDQTVLDAARLILRLVRRGYRIVYNKNMDFTFVRADLLAARARRTAPGLDGTGAEA